MEAIWSRFLPSYRALVDVLGSGRIGTPLQVDADFGFRVPVDPQHRLFDPLQGGGALLDLGIYPLQLCTLVLGPVEHVAASGAVGTTHVDEQVAAALRHDGGGLGVIKAAIRAPLACTARISGTDGWIDLPAFMHCPTSFTVNVFGAGPEVVDAPFDGDGLQFEIREVHRCLGQGLTESPTMTLADTVALATDDGRDPRPGRRHLPGGAVMAPPPRSQRVLGKVMDRWWRLPAPTSDYTITRDLRIPTRDGVDLLADLYEPTGPAAGTILVRSPYGWKPPVAAFFGGVFARRGYRVLLARCRGTFGSGGTFEPMVHEVDDGADTVAWMREQPWFDGRFATYGALVHGVHAVGAADRPATRARDGCRSWSARTTSTPPSTPAARSASTTSSAGPTRPRARRSTAWSAASASSSAVPATSRRPRSELPLVDAGERLLDGRGPWYRDWVTRRDPDDPFWAPVPSSPTRWSACRCRCSSRPAGRTSSSRRRSSSTSACRHAASTSGSPSVRGRTSRR